MYRVVDYYDLRPLDWLSGKRVPLSPGEGHECDRCGAEHAVVYVVLDTDTGKQYKVGSSCARRSFGFEPGETAEAKALARSARAREKAELEAARQEVASRAAAELAREVGALPLPEFTADTERYAPAVAWHLGDSHALAIYGRTDAEAQRVALEGWYSRRLRERIPPEWGRVSVRLRPDSKHEVLMSGKVESLALAELLRRTR